MCFWDCLWARRCDLSALGSGLGPGSFLWLGSLPTSQFVSLSTNNLAKKWFPLYVSSKLRQPSWTLSRSLNRVDWLFGLTSYRLYRSTVYRLRFSWFLPVFYNIFRIHKRALDTMHLIPIQISWTLVLIVDNTGGSELTFSVMTL